MLPPGELPALTPIPKSISPSGVRDPPSFFCLGGRMSKSSLQIPAFVGQT